MRLILICGALFMLFLAGVGSCSKSANPPPPVHDTTVITKIDTVTVPPPPDPTVNLTKGLLLYLPFNGTIADSSGNGNPTEIVTDNNSEVAGLTYDAHGYPNQAYGSDGTGGRLIVTNNGSIQFDTAFSMSFDFMINATQQQTLLSMVDPATGNGPSFISTLSVPGSPDLSTFSNDVTSDCNVAGPTQQQDPDVVTDTAAFAPQPGAWYNVINIYHRGSIRTYVNGQLQGSNTSNGTADLVCPNSKVIVGGWWTFQNNLSLNGKMDEVRLYNRVLTPHEIAALSQHFQVTSERTNPGVVGKTQP